MMSHTASAASLSLSRAASTSSVTAINGPTAGSGSGSGSPSPSGTDPRRRHKQKDDAIRRKVDQELARKTGGSSTSRRSTHGHHGHGHHGHHSHHQQPARLPQAKAGTVAALRPSAPVTIRQSVKVLDAAQLMAARRCDALLVVDQQDRLCGIVTDKDLAFRVVAEGLDLNSTKVFEIMTKNVQFVNANQTASEALSTMIAGGFRHLPVMDDEGDVVGVLDITKCLYDALERIDTIYGSSKKLTDALEDVQRDWASTGINAALSQQFEMIRQKMLCPDLNSILSAESLMPPELGLKANVREAARAMKQFKSTAVLIFDESTSGAGAGAGGGRKLAGIFTSKDIVLRVMSVKADPGATSIIRVMTPHPDTVATHTTIYDALKMMHDNKYLHLPVVDAAVENVANHQVIGLVDVLKLTYNVLEKIQSAREQDGGPAWNEFWTSTFAPEGMSASAGGPGADTESLMSGTLADRTMHSTPSMIRPSDSASVVSDAMSGFMPPPTASASTSTAAAANTASGVPGFDPAHCFVFKFRDPSTLAVHRVTSPTNLAFLVSLLKEKIGQHVEINTLSYADEDGDDIAIQCDADLAAAVAMARDAGLRRILLKLNGVSGAAEQPEYPRRRASGMTGVGGVDDAATDLYAGTGVPSPIPELAAGGSVRSGRGATAQSALSGVSERTAADPGVPVERGTIVPTTEYAVAAPAPSAAAASKRVTWLDKLVGAENALEHPVVLVGMGAVVTLSLVGLVSLVRK